MPLINVDKSLKRLRGDMTLFRRLAEFFAEDHEPLLSQIRDGLKQRNPQLVERGAHTLKGMAANFDADEVVSSALQVERLAAADQLDAAQKEVPRLENGIKALMTELQPYCEPENSQQRLT